MRPLPPEKQDEINQLHGERTTPKDQTPPVGTSNTPSGPHQHPDLEHSQETANPAPIQLDDSSEPQLSPQPLTPEQIESLTALLSLPNHPGCLDFCLQSIPTDTMDYLRQELCSLYGTQVACYSGRGGELYEEGMWLTVPKERIKRMFRAGEIKLLLCTESASEGLNLQTCVLLSMKW